MRCQAFFEHNEASDAAVAVLEGVDALELAVEVEDVFQSPDWLAIVFLEQRFHLGVHFLGRAGGLTAHFIGQALVITHFKPVLPAIGGPGLENSMKFLDQGLCQFIFGVVNDIVYATEVVGGLNDIVYVDGLIRYADGIGFEDVACLLVGQTAALDVVGVVRQIDLCAVVDAAAHLALFLFAKSLQKGRGSLFADTTLGQWRIGRDAPGLAGYEGSLDFSGRTPATDRTLGQSVGFGKFCDG